MKRIPVTNTGDTAIYAAGVLIPPGETRMVEALQLMTTSAGTETPAAAPATDSVLDLLDHSVKDIIAALPEVSDEDLDTLETAEQDGKTRKGVLEALAAERIRRAQATETTPAE